MILLVQDRKSKLHLVDYTPSSGNKYTICGRIYLKKEVMNSLTLITLALDNAIHNVCRTCYEDYETMYGDDLNQDIRMTHSSLNEKMCMKYTFPSIGNARPDVEYWDLEARHWDKLTKYQRKLARK